MINFIAHEVRAGQHGAREDFEQMLGLLVQATHGHAHLVFANPGDWGIDVLVGDLNGRVTIWQAKYFMRGFKQPQKRQVGESFQSAMRNAARRGYAVDRWILCVPLSLDPPGLQWWQNWRVMREREHPGLSVELWDENKLRSLLIKPEAKYVRGAYYELLSGIEAPEPLTLAAPGPVTSIAAWQGGAKCELGHEVYLLHDPVYEWASRDRSHAWREATAERIEPATGPGRHLVRLRQVRMDRRTTEADEQLAGLRAQGALLAQLNGRAGLPRVVREHADRDVLTLITAHPAGRRWRALFGPGPGLGPAARLTAAAALAAAADAAAALTVLHATGASHRAMHPDALFIEGSRCRPQDAGLAAIPAVPGEGGAGVQGSELDGAVGWQAPEQRRSAHLAGPATDVYRLAAIVYQTLTGHPPASRGTPPVRATLPDLPKDVDEVLLRGLEGDPARRPGIGRLAAAFREGRPALSLGGGT
jgi:hypothetical protein